MKQNSSVKSLISVEVCPYEPSFEEAYAAGPERLSSIVKKYGTLQPVLRTQS
jgi:hypothetical protein